MADPIIKLKRSAVPGKIPTTTTLPVGEFAINTYDGKVYIQQDQGGVGVGSTVVVINPWSVGLGSTSFNTYFTNGSVGVGTTTPQYSLDVVGDVNITGEFRKNGVIFSGGGGGGGTSSQWVTTDVGIHTLSNVGIGTTNPLSTLHIAGDLTLTGYISVGGTTGTSGQVLQSTGTGVTWAAAGAFSPTPTKTETSFIATTAQTTFSVTYEVGYIEVYLNGIRLTSTEYTATSGTSVILSEPASLGDIVDIIEIATTGPQGPQGIQGPAGASTRNVYNYTANGIQTSFPATYSVGYLDVYRNGVKLVTNTDFVGSSGTNFYLTEVPSNGDNIEVIGFENIALTSVSLSSDINPSLGENLNLNSKNIIGTGNINITGNINNTGNINISGIITATDFNSTSDINLKKDVKVIDDPLSKVLQIKGVSFNWSSTNQSSAGVIAQDIEKVLPEIVKETEGHKTVNYNGLIGLLVEAVKEQNETIEILKQKINSLEERLI